MRFGLGRDQECSVLPCVSLALVTESEATEGQRQWWAHPALPLGAGKPSPTGQADAEHLPRALVFLGWEVWVQGCVETSLLQGLFGTRAVVLLSGSQPCPNQLEREDSRFPAAPVLELCRVLRTGPPLYLSASASSSVKWAYK